jgi:hypothetical protein
VILSQALYLLVDGAIPASFDYPVLWIRKLLFEGFTVADSLDQQLVSAWISCAVIAAVYGLLMLLSVYTVRRTAHSAVNALLPLVKAVVSLAATFSFIPLLTLATRGIACDRYDGVETAFMVFFPSEECFGPAALPANLSSLVLLMFTLIGHGWFLVFTVDYAPSSRKFSALEAQGPLALMLTAAATIVLTVLTSHVKLLQCAAVALAALASGVYVAIRHPFAIQASNASPIALISTVCTASLTVGTYNAGLTAAVTDFLEASVFIMPAIVVFSTFLLAAILNALRRASLDVDTRTCEALITAARQRSEPEPLTVEAIELGHGPGRSHNESSAGTTPKRTPSRTKAHHKSHRRDSAGAHRSAAAAAAAAKPQGQHGLTPSVVSTLTNLTLDDPSADSSSSSSSSGHSFASSARTLSASSAATQSLSSSPIRASSPNALTAPTGTVIQEVDALGHATSASRLSASNLASLPAALRFPAPRPRASNRNFAPLQPSGVTLTPTCAALLPQPRHPHLPWPPSAPDLLLDALPA